MRASIINILLGLWLMIAPAVLHLGKEASDNNYIFGPIIITFSITALWEVNRSARFLNILPALWLALSPFILGLPLPVTLWATLLPGVLIACFSLIKGSTKQNYGGGWYCLFSKDEQNFSSEKEF